MSKSVLEPQDVEDIGIAKQTSYVLLNIPGKWLAQIRQAVREEWRDCVLQWTKQLEKERRRMSKSKRGMGRKQGNPFPKGKPGLSKPT